MRALFVASVSVCLMGPELLADEFASRRDDNWHHWRGPLASGAAPHGNPPVEWGENNNVRWKVRIPGNGSATPIVWEDQVFILTAVKTDRTVSSLPPLKAEPPGGYKTQRPRHYYRFVIISLDRQTGAVNWQRTAVEEVPHEGHHLNHGYASGSPTTDGRYLYASFGSRGTYCCDLAGNLKWERDLGDMVTRFGWGEGTSPLLHEGSLVVNFDHEGDSFLEVLEAATGRTKWKADRDEITSWSTPLVVEHRGTKQLIVSATRRVTSYNLDTGRILWECGGQTDNVIPSPVILDDTVICMSGFRGSALYSIPLDASGDITGSDRIAWHHGRGTPYVPSPLLYKGLLYFTKSNSAILSILDAKSGGPLREGERLSELREIYASPAGAAGRIYFVGRDGTALVLKEGAGMDVLAVNKLDDPIDASPAIVGKEMLLRGKDHLYCIAAE